MSTKVILAIIVVAVVVGGAVYFMVQQGAPEEQAVPGGLVGQFQVQQPTPQIQYQGTANIEDAVSAALNDTAVDETPNEESDPALLSEDDTAIGGAGQSLDGSQL